MRVRSNFYGFISILGIFSLGCETRNNNASGVAGNGINPVLTKCKKGETAQIFSLKSVSGLTSKLEELKFLKDIDKKLFRDGQEGSEDAKNIRIDICASENFDKFRIANIFVNTQERGLVTFSESNSEISSTGLDSFQFEPNSILSIQAKNKDGLHFDLETVTAVLVDPNDERKEFISKVKALAGVRTQDNKVVLAAVSGVLMSGNPFNLCGIDGEQSEAFSQFSLGTAKFKFDLCLGAGESQGIHYSVKRISVSDSSPNLAESEKKEFIFEGKQLTIPTFVTSLHHHNSCDSFKLVLPHATYFATAATLQGENSCGKVVDGAIQLKDNGKVGAYKIVYKNKTETELKGGFVHYLIDTLVRL